MLRVKGSGYKESTGVCLFWYLACKIIKLMRFVVSLFNAVDLEAVHTKIVIAYYLQTVEMSMNCRELHRICHQFTHLASLSKLGLWVTSCCVTLAESHLVTLNLPVSSKLHCASKWDHLHSTTTVSPRPCLISPSSKEGLVKLISDRVF